MKLQTRFNIGDTAYLLEKGECFRVKINSFLINVENNGSVNISCGATVYVPKGIIKEEEKEIERCEDLFFLSKQEVKDKLKQVKEAEDKLKELSKFGEATNISVTNALVPPSRLFTATHY